MALKELTTKWILALDAFDNSNTLLSIQHFQSINDLSKIQFNLGVLYEAQNDPANAIAHFDKAIQLDSYFSLAYFERGVVFYYIDEIELALDSFKDAYKLLRKNAFIDYRQLGLDYILYEAHCLFNISMCLLLFGDQKGMKLLQKANSRICDGANPKPIKKAMKAGVAAPEKIPIYEVGKLLFKPPKENILNEKKVNHLGESKLIASSSTDNFQGFSGRQLKVNYKLTKEQQKSFKEKTLRKEAEPIKRSNPKRRQAKKYYAPPSSSDNSEEYGAPLSPALSHSGSNSGDERTFYRKNSAGNTYVPPRKNSAGNTYIPPRKNSINANTIQRTNQYNYHNEYNSSTSTTLKIKAQFLEPKIIKVEKSISFQELQAKLRQKFKEDMLRFKYRDGGTMVVMHNDDDLEDAISSCDGVLELFCYLPC